MFPPSIKSLCCGNTLSDLKKTPDSIFRQDNPAERGVILSKKYLCSYTFLEMLILCALMFFYVGVGVMIVDRFKVFGFNREPGDIGIIV